MRAPLLLLAHSVKRVRALVAAMGLVLCGFQVVLILVARSIQTSGGFESLSAMLPPFARELMGPSLAAFMSFGGIVCLGYFHLVVISSLIAMCIALATMPASEIETGFIDLILARPLARYWIITRSIVLVLLGVVFLLVMMMLGTWLGLTLLAPAGAEWPPSALIRALAENLGLLLLCWSGVAMAIGSGSHRRGVAGAITGFLALITFLLDFVGRLWQPAESIAWISPFRYDNALDLIMGNTLPLKNVAVLSGVALVGFAVAYVVFSKRDIAH